MALKPHLIFRSIWWASNLLLAVALVATIWSGVWELSVRRYLRGFSDAIVAEAAAPQQKAEAILAWMQNGPPRLETALPTQLSPRDPEDTLNYRQLLEVCGSATNAFLNLSRSAGLETRRLLLLTPARTTKHVVAEVKVNGRWVIVDATYRTFLKDTHGNLLTRKDLQDPELFREATSALPNYPPEYTYDRFAHVRISALPFQGTQVRRLLDRFFPTWDEYINWSLLLERRSFLYFFFSVNSLLALMFLRAVLGWLADHHLQVPRFRLRANLSRATAAFFTTPEIK
ncbi:MAG TPA: transglutaminase domain-containing protein [Candidatus Sulfotelmatobacter sp.]|nr:transglutaminase domain-containing protein [Candidatus Sulfotelmatobacter sp.]